MDEFSDELRGVSDQGFFNEQIFVGDSPVRFLGCRLVRYFSVAWRLQFQAFRREFVIEIQPGSGDDGSTAGGSGCVDGMASVSGSRF